MDRLAALSTKLLGWNDKRQNVLCNGVSSIPQACGGNDMSLMEGITCYSMCPSNCSYGYWSPWSPCSASCGYGMTDRHRNCSCDGITSPVGSCGGVDTDLFECKSLSLLVNSCVLTNCRDFLQHESLSPTKHRLLHD